MSIKFQLKWDISDKKQSHIISWVFGLVAENLKREVY